MAQGVKNAGCSSTITWRDLQSPIIPLSGCLMASIGATRPPPPPEIFKTTNKQVIWMWSHEVLVNSKQLLVSSQI